MGMWGPKPGLARYDDNAAMRVNMLALACLLPSVINVVNLKDERVKTLLGACVGICVVTFAATMRLVGVVSKATLKRGMFGYDINKRGTPQGEVKVPEVGRCKLDPGLKAPPGFKV